MHIYQDQQGRFIITSLVLQLVHHFGSGFFSRHSHLYCSTSRFMIQDTQDIFSVCPITAKALLCVLHILHIGFCESSLKMLCWQSHGKLNTSFFYMLLQLCTYPLSSFFPFFHSISQQLLPSNATNYLHPTGFIRYTVKLLALIHNLRLLTPQPAICQIFHCLLLILMLLSVQETLL